LAVFLMVLISLSTGVSLLLLVPLLELVGLNVGQGSLGVISAYVFAFFLTVHLKPTLFIILLVYVLVMSFMAILHRLQTIKSSQIQFEFAAHLRKRLYRAITNSDWLFFTRMKSSSFAHALTNEVERVSVGTGQFLNLLAGLMVLVVYIIFALELAGVTTGLIFIAGVIILLLLRRRVRRSISSGENITDTTRDIYNSIMQHLDGMKTIKSFGMQDENIKVFSDQTNQVMDGYLDAVKTYADVKLLFDVGTVIMLAIIVLTLIQLVKIPIASLFILIYIFVMMIPQFSTIQSSYQYFINSLPAFDNINQLEMQCLQNIDSTESEGDVMVLENMINFDHIFFSYRGEDHFKIEDLNLRIPVGETIAITGSSGTGKSTVADLLMGLIQPDSGVIKVDNVPLAQDNLLSWRDRIGYVAQETFLFNETIRFNLLLTQPGAVEEDLINSLRLAAAYDFVMELPDGLDTFIGDRGVKLSGGEKQRLALARALLSKPSIIILDEATSNLDSENEKRILNSVENLHGDITILMIAHRLSTIRNADQIYFMENGSIVESGTWDELLSKNNGKFNSFHKFQSIEQE
jgi:ATP-binding cassette subfamily C protein